MEIRCCFCCEDYRLIFEDEYGEDESSTYKCCRSVHIKTAAMYVGISAIILSIFSTICMFFGVYSVNLWLDIVLIVLNTVVAIILLIGLYYEKAILMVPFIITEVAQCTLFFMLATYTLYFTLTQKEQHFLRKFDQMLMVISIYVGIVVAGSAVWVAAKCYHYLKAKEQGMGSPELGNRRRSRRQTEEGGFWL